MRHQRGELLSQVPALQEEWAHKYSHLSVRSYLIYQKKLTPRQYKRVLEHRNKHDWECVKNEVQNCVVAASRERCLEEAVQVLKLQVTASKLAVVRCMEALSQPSLSPKSLLALVTALRTSQEVTLRALGIKEGRGLLDIENEIKSRNEKPEMVQNDKLEREQTNSEIGYNQIFEFVKRMREERGKESVTRAP